MPPQQQVSCAFNHSLDRIFPIDCILNGEEDYYDLKTRIKETRGLQGHDINLWFLYRPGSVLDKSTVFVPAKDNNDCQLFSHLPITLEPRSGDPDIDIVVVVVDKRSLDTRRDISVEFADTGISSLSLMSGRVDSL